MKFMMIVKANKEYEAGMPPDPKLIEVIGKYSQEMAEKGILLSNGGLLPSSKGARIKVTGGKMMVTDGPFAETKELVGGFAILEANSKEHAVELGKQFMQLHVDTLGTKYDGDLEVRPMWGPEGCGGGNHD